jgi:hypothetical protein
LGNHELFSQDDVRNGKKMFPITNKMLTAGLHDIQGLNVVALPSTPMPGIAPGPALFSDEDYDICWNVDVPVDIFLSHGCGFPLMVFLGKQMKNVEDIAITKLLKKLVPTYAVSGHNHQFERKLENGIQLIRLGRENSPEVVEVVTFE